MGIGQKNKVNKWSLIIAFMMITMTWSSRVSMAEEVKKETKQQMIVLHIGSSDVIVNKVKMKINPTDPAIKTVLINEKAYIPLRFSVEAFGGKVVWNEEKQTSSIHVDLNDFIVDYQKKEVTLDSKTVPIDLQIIRGTTLVPLRMFAELLKKTVMYQDGLILISDGPLEVQTNQMVEWMATFRYYEVFQNDKPLKLFKELNEAKLYGESLVRAKIKYSLQENILWNNYKLYSVYQNEILLLEKDDFISALTYAKQFKNSSVMKNDIKIWSNRDVLPSTAWIEGVPLITQLPELARGCEVTALAMLINFMGLNTDKLILAEKLKKDPTPYKEVDGHMYFGNPENGFVGDMYTFSNPGFGVYHGPIFELADYYLPGKMLDFTGCDFEDLLFAVAQGKPVWIITNILYDIVPDMYFQTWITPNGEKRITKKEHSVVVMGYDNDFVYIKDPRNEKVKLPRYTFQRAWEQMGRQAITFMEVQN